MTRRRRSVGRLLASMLVGMVAASTPHAGTTAASLDAPAIWAGLEPGAYPVGFHQTDESGGRVETWFPAGDGGTPMTFRRYLGTGADDYEKVLTANHVPVTSADAYLNAPMFARRGLSAADGDWPVVLVAQGNGQSASDQAVLAEYLASHGFVVVSTPSPTIATPMSSEDQVGPFAARQADDLIRAAGVVRRWPTADARRTAVVGHSFGARAALLVAMRDETVRAVVSLDGGIGTATAIDSYERTPSFVPARATAPILHFYEELDAFMKPDFTLLRSLPAPLETVPTRDMHHIHFTTLGFAAATVPDIGRVTGAGPRERDSVTMVARRTLGFLETHLK